MVVLDGSTEQRWAVRMNASGDIVHTLQPIGSVDGLYRVTGLAIGAGHTFIAAGFELNATRHFSIHVWDSKDTYQYSFPVNGSDDDSVPFPTVAVDSVHREVYSFWSVNGSIDVYSIEGRWTRSITVNQTDAYYSDMKVIAPIKSDPFLAIVGPTSFTRLALNGSVISQLQPEHAELSFLSCDVDIDTGFLYIATRSSTTAWVRVYDSQYRLIPLGPGVSAWTHQLTS